MIKVFDNFIPERYVDEIDNLLFNKWNWGFVGDVTVRKDHLEDASDDYIPRPAVSKALIKNCETIINIDFIYPMILIAAEKAGVNFDQIAQSRAFMQFPIITDGTLDPAHVDLHIPHTVVLYYINDSDAQTIIYNKKDDGYGDDYIYDTESLEVLEKVTPKKGRVVVFDGRYYHTAEQPTKGMRCILNTNLILN